MNVPAGEFPLGVLLMEYDPPDILLGKPPSRLAGGRLRSVYVASEARNLVVKYGASGFRFGEFQPLLFSRMLAKIAHSYAVAKRGFGSFDPLLPDLILGKTTSASYLIGGGSEHSAPENALHHLNITNVNADGIEYVVVHIHLLAAMGTPSYLAVVGTLPPKAPAWSHLGRSPRIADD